MWNTVFVRGWRLSSLMRSSVLAERLIGKNVRCVHHTCCVWDRLKSSSAADVKSAVKTEDGRGDEYKKRHKSLEGLGEGLRDIKSGTSKWVQEWKDRRENIWTVPNALCMIRIGMAPVLAYMILHNQYSPAIGLFAVAGVTDLLDGWIARVVPGQSSVMGSFLDPLADKILVGTLFISLTYMDLIPVPLTALIIGRDAILFTAGFYIRFQSLDPPRTLSRYFDVRVPTAQLAPTLLSKVNTGVQLGLIGATLLSTVLPYDAHPFLQVLWYFTAATTTMSAVGYVFAKDTVKLLKTRRKNISVKNKSTDETNSK